MKNNHLKSERVGVEEWGGGGVGVVAQAFNPSQVRRQRQVVLWDVSKINK